MKRHHANTSKAKMMVSTTTTWRRPLCFLLSTALVVVFVSTAFVCILISSTTSRTTSIISLDNKNDFPNTSLSRRLTKSEFDPYRSLELFAVSDYRVLGPTKFPKPSLFAGQFSRPALEPQHGRHRPHVDAVFAFAAEYDLRIYQCFLETLRRTGFTGDVVLAISPQDLKQRNVKEYLLQQQQQQQQDNRNDLNVVIYVVTLSCFNAEFQAVNSAKGGIRLCQIHDLYTNGAKQTPTKDPRPPRTLQTTRYELYWIWSLHYHRHSWIMLVDARDTYFQTNPFTNVPRDTDDLSDGVLHFFGENTDATRIGQSPKNRKWITNAYGEEVIRILENKPTICSGSTMGEQIALETYLRAMVAESDETLVKLMGADQGFHNYLYYTHKLANADTIRRIVVFGQGLGAMNNLGAMRTRQLGDWGNGNLLQQKDKEWTVHNWDGSLSPVVHQFDRHDVLSKYIYKQKALEFEQEWRARSKKRQVMKFGN